MFSTRRAENTLQSFFNQGLQTLGADSGTCCSPLPAQPAAPAREENAVDFHTYPVFQLLPFIFGSVSCLLPFS